MRSWPLLRTDARHPRTSHFVQPGPPRVGLTRRSLHEAQRTSNLHSLLLRLYGAATWLLQPMLRRKLRRRAVAEPGYAIAVEERFGHYDEAMSGSDSPTNLAWLINQNSPTSRIEGMEAADEQSTNRRVMAADFESMTISPEMLERG